MRLCGCAAVPPAPTTVEYQVPFVTLDDTLEMKTTKPLPGDMGRLFVCIEFNDGTLCITEDKGKTARVFIPHGMP